MSVIFQIGTVASNYIAAISKTRFNIILFKFISAVCNALAITVTSGIVLALPVFISAIRNIVCLFKSKFKTNIPVYILIGMYIVIGIYTAIDMDSVIDLLPTFVSLVATFANWFATPSGIKYSSMVTTSIWLVFYITSGLYITFITSLIHVMLEVVGLIRIAIDKRKRLS